MTWARRRALRHHLHRKHPPPHRHRHSIPRLLRHPPDGVFVSWDPVAYNPIINIYRAIATKVRTADEHPLRMRDIRAVSSHFEKTERHWFWYSTLLIFMLMAAVQFRSPNKERFWKKVVEESDSWAWLYRPLAAFDRVVPQGGSPFLRPLCWNVVVGRGLRRNNEAAPSPRPPNSLSPPQQRGAGLPEFVARVSTVCQRIGTAYEIILVNDGSRDNTLPVALRLAQPIRHLRIVNFFRNFGHQAAVTVPVSTSAMEMLSSSSTSTCRTRPKSSSRWPPNGAREWMRPMASVAPAPASPLFQARHGKALLPHPVLDDQPQHPASTPATSA